MESHAEQITRVERIAAGDPTWDLSDNDTAALTTVLKERSELLKWLKFYANGPGGHPEARIAIGEAQGKRMRITLTCSFCGGPLNRELSCQNQCAGNGRD